jgi:hypothetical protein
VLTAEQVPELAAAEMERFERRGADPLALTSLRRAAALRERSAHRAAGEMARPPK